MFAVPAWSLPRVAALLAGCAVAIASIAAGCGARRTRVGVDPSEYLVVGVDPAREARDVAADAEAHGYRCRVRDVDVVHAAVVSCERGDGTRSRVRIVTEHGVAYSEDGTTTDPTAPVRTVRSPAVIALAGALRAAIIIERAEGGSECVIGLAVRNGHVCRVPLPSPHDARACTDGRGETFAADCDRRDPDAGVAARTSGGVAGEPHEPQIAAPAGESDAGAIPDPPP